MTARTAVQPGQMFNSWKLLEEAPQTAHGIRMWRVRCECGTIKVRPLSRVVKGITKHCGCKGKAPSRKRAKTNAEILRLHELYGKECSMCYQRKPLDQFWKAGVGKTSADGYQHTCTECMKGEQAERYLKRKGLDRKLTKAERDAANIKLPEQIGQVYNRLTVVEEAPKRNGRRYMRCSCECGGEITTLLAALRSGNTKSCGCMAREGTTNLRRKVCRVCDTEKDNDNFRRYKSGGRHSVCQACEISSEKERQAVYRKMGEQFVENREGPLPPWAQPK